ncbi:hypothetical protein QBC38DRAFT_492645 [Podospora fimiseda]|uniref:Ankyrin repeat protein n=1 Tax=Podospora fimiseda TaxID=252190 RepID=A0AAN7BCW6_9PEZI|nr:hypothetical protein QBC38DRAFT_492645 [Podospora fimiseda]
MPIKPCSDSEVIHRTLISAEWEAKEAGVTLPSPDLPLSDFLSALKACGAPVHTSTFADFLSGQHALIACDDFHKHNNSSLPVPCTVDQARAWLAVFPLETLNFPSDEDSVSATSTAKYKLQQYRSVDLLLPLARWPRENSDRLEVARMLLENNGADPNDNTLIYHCWCYTPSELGMAPIHIAAGTGDKEMVELLLEFGANTEKKDGYGRRALDLAKEKGMEDVVKFLEEQNVRRKQFNPDSNL